MECTSEEGCTNAVVYTSLMLCQNHYRKVKRLERGLKSPGRKPDPTKPTSRYNPNSSHHGNNTHCAENHELSGDNLIVGADNRRICRTCHEGKELPPDCRKGHLFTDDNTYWWGGNRYCKECAKVRQSVYRRIKKYGLTPEIYEEMLKEQDNLCAICSNSFEDFRACVDHDHSCCSGQDTCGECIREIICIKCNTLLGQANDSIELLEKHIAYIRKHTKGEENGT
jgi:hypothetical protein